MIEVKITMAEVKPFLDRLDYVGYRYYIGEKLRAAGVPVQDLHNFYHVSHGELRRMDDYLSWTNMVYQWQP